MTDEGQLGNPIDAIELTEALKNVATSARTLRDSLVDEGFSEEDTTRMLLAWIHAIAGGKISG